MRRLKRHWRKAAAAMAGFAVLVSAATGVLVSTQPTASSTNQAEQGGLTVTQVHPSPAVETYTAGLRARAEGQGYSNVRSAIYGTFTSPETGITYYAVVARADKDGAVTEVGFHIYVKDGEIVQVD